MHDQRCERTVCGLTTKHLLCFNTGQHPEQACCPDWFVSRIRIISLQQALDYPEVTINGGGHFLQETHGEELAHECADFIHATPI
jgi:pimeloyl-ACP methyl ester carboxylesterase